MRKTDIKTTIFIISALLGGIFSANSALANPISKESVIALVNQEREKAGMAVLVENENLSRSAQEKAQDMFEKDYFAHISPDGLTPWHWIEKNGYTYEFAGENLAINFKSVEKQNAMLMDSATHRKNILGAQFNEIGVAVASGIIDGKETTITVQQFGNRGVAVALPEKKAEPERVDDVETKRTALIDSSIAFGKDDFSGMFEGLLPAWLFAFVIAGALEVLKSIHAINPSGSALAFAEESGDVAGSRPVDFEKTETIYLHQMKQLE